MSDRIQQIEQLLAQQPKDSFLRHALALEWIKRNELERGIALFEAVLADQPDYIGSYYHLAMAYRNSHKDEAAISTLQKGMEKAKAVNDRHAYAEMQGLLDEFEGY